MKLQNNHTREKNSGSFFSKYRQLFRIFLGKFLDISRNFRDFSGNFLEKFQPILDRFYRYFSRRKKQKNNNIRLLSGNFVSNFVKFQGAEFLINFLFSLFFFEKFREISNEISGNKIDIFSAEFRRIN
jgi:hypothetical protein